MTRLRDAATQAGTKGGSLRFERPAALIATRPPAVRDAVRLLVSTERGHEHAVFRDLPRLLAPGTVLVVNASATLAASLPARGAAGDFILNLSTPFGRGLWLAEPRWSPEQPGPVPVLAGERLVAGGLPARMVWSYPGHDWLWLVAFDGDVDRAMAEQGAPIRYGHVAPPLPPLEAYQTVFARAPGSTEMPSAGRPFTAAVLEALAARGVQVVPIVLHCGLSTVELDPDDAVGMLPERFAVPAATVAAVNAARAEARPVIAVGTTVIRALESAWDGQRVRAAAGMTRVFVHPGRGLRAVDGLITGLHEPQSTHLAMLQALAGEEFVRGAYRVALAAGYLWHEFGDSHLIVPGSPGVTS